MTHTATHATTSSRVPAVVTSAPARSWARGSALVDRARFWLYRNLLALKEWRDFRATQLIPLAPPTGGPEA